MHKSLYITWYRILSSGSLNEIKRSPYDNCDILSYCFFCAFPFQSHVSSFWLKFWWRLNYINKNINNNISLFLSCSLSLSLVFIITHCILLDKCLLGSCERMPVPRTRAPLQKRAKNVFSAYKSEPVCHRNYTLS